MVIKLTNFSFRYLNSDNYILKNINLAIKKGEFILICGATGSGKTTLARSLNGLIPHFYSGYIKGNIEVNGLNTKKYKVSKLSRNLGLVFQNPENQLVCFNVEKELAFGLENIGLKREEIIKRIDDIMEQIGIFKLRHMAPYDLSTGEQQKVAISSVLTFNPIIICLDEPTSSLDPLTAKILIQLLYKLNQELKITVIIFEHRLELIVPYATRIITLKNGSILYDGKPREILIKDNLQEIGINLPKVIKLYKEFSKEGLKFSQLPLSIPEFIEEIQRFVR